MVTPIDALKTNQTNKQTKKGYIMYRCTENKAKMQSVKEDQEFSAKFSWVKLTT